MKTLIKAVLIAVLSFIIYLPINAQTNWLKPVVSITGSIIDKNNEKAIGLTIRVLDKENKIIGKFKSNDSDGSYFITGLKANCDYILSFEADDIIKKTLQIHTPNIDSYKEIVMDFYVKAKVKKNDLQSQKI